MKVEEEGLSASPLQGGATQSTLARWSRRIQQLESDGRWHVGDLQFPQVWWLDARSHSHSSLFTLHSFPSFMPHSGSVEIGPKLPLTMHVTLLQ